MEHLSWGKHTINARYASFIMKANNGLRHAKLGAKSIIVTI